MSWKSGGEVAQNIWNVIEPYISEEEKSSVVKEIVDIFLDYDCDTIYGCEFVNQYLPDADF